MMMHNEGFHSETSNVDLQSTNPPPPPTSANSFLQYTAPQICIGTFQHLLEQATPPVAAAQPFNPYPGAMDASQYLGLQPAIASENIGGLLRPVGRMMSCMSFSDGSIASGAESGLQYFNRMHIAGQLPRSFAELGCNGLRWENPSLHQQGGGGGGGPAHPPLYCLPPAVFSTSRSSPCLFDPAGAVHPAGDTTLLKRINMAKYINPEIFPSRRSTQAEKLLLDAKESPSPRKPPHKRSTAIELLNYKTVMCQAWLESKICTFGTSCRFAHGERELRPTKSLSPAANAKYKTKLCENYTTAGICPFGDRCLFIHPEPQPYQQLLPSQSHGKMRASSASPTNHLHPCSDNQFDAITSFTSQGHLLYNTSTNTLSMGCIGRGEQGCLLSSAYPNGAVLLSQPNSPNPATTLTLADGAAKPRLTRANSITTLSQETDAGQNDATTTADLLAVVRSDSGERKEAEIQQHQQEAIKKLEKFLFSSHSETSEDNPGYDSETLLKKKASTDS